jgi:hypothetical protein
MSWMLNWVRAAAGQVRNRLLGGLVTRVDSCDQQGERTEPALLLKRLWVENATGENAHLRGFRAELSVPVRATTENVELRIHDKPVVVDLPVNIPAWGSSECFDAVIKFQATYPPGASRFQGRIAALGRGGFRLRWARLSGPYDWRGK